MDSFIWASVLVYAILVRWFIFYFGLTDRNVDEETSEGQRRIACVGDSNTYGLFIADRDRWNYPKQLSELLGEGYCVRNYGLNNRNLINTDPKPYFREPRYVDSLSFKPDGVVVMLGTNDTKRKIWSANSDRFSDDYRKLMDLYVDADPNVRFILITPCRILNGRWWGLDDAPLAEIREKIFLVGKEYDAQVIDLYSMTEGHKEYYSFDGVHLNRRGAEMVAGAVAEAVGKIGDRLDELDAGEQ